jgi:hypothetical protein
VIAGINEFKRLARREVQVRKSIESDSRRGHDRSHLRRQSME